MKDIIQFEDMMKLDVQVCLVTSASRVPKKDKLLQLEVMTSEGVKQAVTNIGEFYEPEVLIGKYMPFVLNLSPVKIGGIQSEAMIVCSSTPDHSSKPDLIEIGNIIGNRIF